MQVKSTYHLRKSPRLTDPLNDDGYRDADEQLMDAKIALREGISLLYQALAHGRMPAEWRAGAQVYLEQFSHGEIE